MHLYFSGIGGAGIGPLALIAKQAGYQVSGSDKQDSDYLAYLKQHGIDDVHVGQDESGIAAIHQKLPIDWFVYSSALAIENPDAPELKFCQANSIKATKRDELLNQIIKDKKLKLIAIAGTHGKTTTTAMAVWAFKQLGIPLSYSLPAKVSYGEMGEYVVGSEYFVYEADEFDHNFLAFHPYLSLITGIAWDHPDIYPTKEDYQAAFSQFVKQSEWVGLWQSDYDLLGLESNDHYMVLDKKDAQLSLAGAVNRQDAWLVAKLLAELTQKSLDQIVEIMNKFPGVSRRFEQIAPNVYTDYAHTPEKIQGALQLAHEVAGNNVVVVYEGLHNTRQHFIKEQLRHMFDHIKQLYVVPSYLAREDPNLQMLEPKDLVGLMSQYAPAEPAKLDDGLKQSIQAHADMGDLVLCLSAGGGGSLDEWLRQNFNS